jgi:rubrerythrin
MENPLVRLSATIDQEVRRHIFAQSSAKAFALAAYADAEDSGEGQVFERALDYVTEPRLRRMVETHRDDERRHARILRERRDQLGLTVLQVPAHLSLIDRLSDAAGGVLDADLSNPEQLAEAWALLFVIEERALDEFKRSGDALAFAGDDESASLFYSIRRDEERHLRFCTTVGEHYDPQGFSARVARLRTVELAIYGAQQRQWTLHQLRKGYLTLPTVLNAVVRGMTTLADWFSLPAMAPDLDGSPRNKVEPVAA